jgi:hypothetical protein
MAIQMDYPVYCNLFVNRLDYDYTRYHLDGIAQYYVSGYKQGLESCKKAIEYNQAIVTPIKEYILKLTNDFIKMVATTRPKMTSHVLSCIHLAHSGHVQYVTKLCNKFDVGDTDLVESSIHYSSEYINYAKEGQIKQVMEYTNAIMRELHMQLDEISKQPEKDVEKINELMAKRGEILQFNDKLMHVGLHALQTALQLDETECKTLTNIVMQAMQKNSFEMKLEADKNNLKFYQDKLAEIKKEKKEKEIVEAIQEVEQEIRRQQVKKKKDGKRK